VGGVTRRREILAPKLSGRTHGGPADGLGATLDQLRGVCRSDPEALDAIDRATEGRQGERTDLGNNVPEVGAEAPTGNTSARALRRLRKDRPDIHRRVLAGELTPHAAAVEAGVFPKRVSVSPGCSSLDFRHFQDFDRSIASGVPRSRRGGSLKTV